MEKTDDRKLNLQQLMRELDALHRAASAAGLRRFTEYARAAQQVEGMLTAGYRVWLEFDARVGEVMITWQEGEQFRTARGEDLPDALQGAEPAADGKVCLGPCGSWRPLTAYSKDTNRADGKCQRCKTCERLRVRAHGKRRRGAAAG